MKIDHQPGGRSLADTAALVVLLARPAAAIRKHCPRDEAGYDIALCEQILAGEDDPILMTARQAEQYLGIPAGTVRAWACRGQLRSYDHTPDGLRPMYDVGDLLRLKEGAREEIDQ